MKSIDFLHLWLKDIILVFIFISLVELAIPKGKMKKYINMVFGFLIIIVIISPFVKLINSNYSFTRSLYKNQLRGVGFEEKDYGGLAETQENQIKDLYRGKIREEMKGVIRQHTDKTIDYIDFQLEHGEENFGRLLSIEIILREEEQASQDGHIKIEKIKDVKVSQGEEEREEYQELNHNQLKEDLSKKYSLAKDKIKILINNRAGEEGGEV